MPGLLQNSEGTALALIWRQQSWLNQVRVLDFVASTRPHLALYRSYPPCRRKSPISPHVRLRGRSEYRLALLLRNCGGSIGTRVAKPVSHRYDALEHLFEGKVGSDLEVAGRAASAAVAGRSEEALSHKSRLARGKSPTNIFGHNLCTYKASTPIKRSLSDIWVASIAAEVSARGIVCRPVTAKLAKATS